MNNDSIHSSFNSTPPGVRSPAANSIYDDGGLVKAPVTDLGNAEILANMYRDRTAFVPGWGWMVYNGKHWEAGEYRVLDFAGDVVRARIAAFKSGDASNAVTARNLAQLDACSNKARLKGMLDLAASKLYKPAKIFDAHPFLLNVGNGVVNLRSGALLAHSPGLFITRWSPVEYSWEASSRLWVDTVDGIACGDAELAGFLQRLGGYAASGDVSLQLFFYFFGEGANGKSLMTDLWAEALGGFQDAGYAVRLPNETVLGGNERTAGTPTPDLLALKGKRLALLSEQSCDRPLNTERIKDLTGGDSITARAPFREPITFLPTHTLICCGNHVPYINAADHGFWRRFMVVPFRGRFKPSRLGEELRTSEQLSAILAWLVRGAMLLNTTDLNIPAVVEDASRECRHEAEPLRGWIEERCESSGEERTTTLFADFDAWCARRREHRMSQSRFTRKLKQMGYGARKSNGQVLVWGIRLKRELIPEVGVVLSNDIQR
jgi:putative DNA primase/helicase